MTTTTEARRIIETARQHLKNKNYEAAVGLLTAHLQRAPLDVEALNVLGLAYFQLRRFLDAKSAYLAMWSIDPTDYRALFGTGMALQKLGDFGDAEHWFRATLTAKPDFERAATRLSQLPAARAAAQSPVSGTTASGGSKKVTLTTLSLPDNEEDLDAYRTSSRERARIDTMNQHWYGIPWPIRVIQVVGIVVIFLFLVQGFLTWPT